MTKKIKYIELDDFFIEKISSYKDDYQELESFLTEEIKDNFKKVLDKVKPIRDIRLCTDEEVQKYNLLYNKDIQNAIDYENCYKTLLDQVKDKTSEEKIDYIVPYVPYLRGLLHVIESAVDDNEVFRHYHKNKTIAFLLVYRYEHNISILNDLHMELSRSSVDIYNTELSSKLAQEKAQRILDMKKNNPEKYNKMIIRKRENFDRVMKSIDKLAKEKHIR